MPEAARLVPAAVAVVSYLAILWMERRWPLRRPGHPKGDRVIRNLTLGATGSLMLRLGFYPALLAFASYAERRGMGLLSLLPDGLPRSILGFLALDYTLYLWHRVNHQVAFFWRFHNPHHVDLDMDVSTGSRFHPGELALSAGVRALEIAALGIPPAVMLTYDLVVMAAVHFHHSNVRLPARLEQRLSLLLVTPRMHGIHHSIVRGETDSNFSTIFSLWDRLHRSHRTGIGEDAIVIGVPSYREPTEVTLVPVLLMPFRRQRPWRLPDGRVPARRPDGRLELRRDRAEHLT